MYNFTKVLPTTKKTKGINTKEYIIIHHTAWWTFESNCNMLSWDKFSVSCHFVIWPKWEIAKIWDPDDILWHAWVSEWKGKENMNRYSLGIEVVWPNKEGKFTMEQNIAVKSLIRYLMDTFKIPNYNVLRHKDIAPWRKTDIADSFWNFKYSSWEEYQKSL